MTLTNALLALIVVMLAYVVYKLRIGVSKIFQTHQSVLDLRRYGLTVVGRQLQAFLGLTDLVRLEEPMPLLGGMAASPDFLLELAKRIRSRKPEVVVELGSGSSTLVVSRMLQQNGSGHIYSLDHDALYAGRTRELLREHGLEAFATVIHAPLVASDHQVAGVGWYSTDELPETEIDLLIVDGPLGVPGVSVRYPAGPELIPRLSPRGIVMVDDTAREEDGEMVHRWAEEFPELTVAEIPCEKGLMLLSRGEAAIA